MIPMYPSKNIFFGHNHKPQLGRPQHVITMTKTMTKCGKMEFCTHG
jgi:hypothetical protein